MLLPFTSLHLGYCLSALIFGSLPSFIPSPQLFVQLHSISKWTAQLTWLNFVSSTYVLKVQLWEDSCPHCRDNPNRPGLARKEYIFTPPISSYHCVSLFSMKLFVEFIYIVVVCQTCSERHAKSLQTAPLKTGVGIHLF